jgi:tRNA A-37 threonylcarbamoyl transferase component Bud32
LFFGVFPQILNFLSQNVDAFYRFQNPPRKRGAGFSTNFIDPQEFVLVPTAEGYVSLADKLDIRGFAKKVLKLTDSGKIKVEQFGNYLNDIYLIKADINDKETKILVKRFRDLSSFKWFPLSMWSIGTTTFALLGKPRLERECAINKVLAEAGFCVPKLLHVSANERLVFMEYIEGENFSNVIKRIAIASSVEKAENELALVTQVGETYARVHALNVVLGDTKPENVMVKAKGELCLLDFEQASRKGEKAWDVACFLYYCGHHLPVASELKAEAVAKAFITGYLRAGGDVLVVKCAGSPRYTRVFSIFTLPSILRVMASTSTKTKNQK